ncbi:MAG TPA: hypothetical protein VEG38_16605 [Acidimicrobiia bacterium]|nr:hypothetical protein [Acidimicrobiia bacterium]
MRPWLNAWKEWLKSSPPISTRPTTKAASSDESSATPKAVDRLEEATETLEVAVEVADTERQTARDAASALTSEVQTLRQDITTLQQIDQFKARVYVVALAAAAFSAAGFITLLVLAYGMNSNTNAIRTDLEVHRIRNEASHDCLAEKMAKLPGPEQRAGQEITREFLHEFLGCVADVAPTIVPPGAPDVRVSTRDERPKE